jgi:prepilin-type N-terminal cleavage/methylation domain-containing protein
MFFKQLKTKGFTLIELLVVVAIISLLSSIVMTSLNSARGKAKDATIKSAMTQVVNIMELNFSDYGSYCQIHPSVWVNTSGYTCDVLLSSGRFSGTYAEKARDLCNIIYNNANGANDPNRFLIYVNPTTCANTYSWDVLLNNGKWYCVGSSGRKGEYSSYSTYPGCYNNP